MKTKTIVLILLILIFGTFIYLKVQVLGSDSSGFNQSTRFQLGRYTWVRSLLGLHKDGDARNWYLTGPGPIGIIVVKAENVSLSDKVLNDFAKEVVKVTGRQARVFNEDTFKSGNLTDQDLADISKTKRREFLPGQPDLFVIYAQDFTGRPNEIGRTYQEFGMVLSDQKVNDLVSGIYAAKDNYVLSTMVHEFGHQLGLDHNSYYGCIMNQEVESPSRIFNYTNPALPVSLCDRELEQIKEIKDKLR